MPEEPQITIRDKHTEYLSTLCQSPQFREHFIDGFLQQFEATYLEDLKGGPANQLEILRDRWLHMQQLRATLRALPDVLAQKKQEAEQQQKIQAVAQQEGRGTLAE